MEPIQSDTESETGQASADRQFPQARFGDRDFLAQSPFFNDWIADHEDGASAITGNAEFASDFEMAHGISALAYDETVAEGEAHHEQRFDQNSLPVDSEAEDWNAEQGEVEFCGEGGAERGEEYAVAFDGEAWSGDAGQIAFMERVLAAHIERSRRNIGAPQRDLRDDELKLVPGHSIKMRTDAALAAGLLLSAANMALSVAKASGDSVAAKVSHLGANSGYRPRQYQLNLWTQYFSAPGGYYERTASARAALPGGPHSAAAIDYLLRRKKAGGFGLAGRIAAPGYSNHQNGIAIDFANFDVKGNLAVPNKSDDQSRARWRASWFHRWLTANAAGFGFKPIDTEEWHWEYKPDSTTGARAPTIRAAVRVASRGTTLPGKTWRFQAKTLGTGASIYLSKAALGAGAVEILLFAHGLLDACQKGAGSGAGIIDRPPFNFGAIVERSGRPLVLVVPELDWRRDVRWHPLADPALLNTFLVELLLELTRAQRKFVPVFCQRLIIAGHSRAYGFLEPLAKSRSHSQMREGVLSRLTDVWAFDTAYVGDPSAWKNWVQENPKLSAQVFYRTGSKTEKLGNSFRTAQSPRLKVVAVDPSESHCSLPAKRLAALLTPKIAFSSANEAENFFATEEELIDSEAGAVCPHCHQEISGEVEGSVFEREESDFNYEAIEADGEDGEVLHEPQFESFDADMESADFDGEEALDLDREEYGPESEELFDEGEGDFDRENLEPDVLALAERLFSNEVIDEEDQLSSRWTRCFKDGDISRLAKTYSDNAAAAASSADDRCSCIVMLNVGLGQLLSLLLKKNRARGSSTREVDMAKLPTKSISAAMAVLEKKGFARSPYKFEFADRKGRKAGTTKPVSLRESVQKKVIALSKGAKCWFAYGLSIMDDYHSVLLVVDNRGSAPKIFWLDQFSTAIDDDVTATLDARLTEKTINWWQAVWDAKRKGYNTRVKIWPLRRVR